MEELLVYAILICEGFDLEDEFQSRLDEMFLNNPNNDDLLELECMSNIKNQIVYSADGINYIDHTEKVNCGISFYKFKVFCN